MNSNNLLYSSISCLIILCIIGLMGAFLKLLPFIVICIIICLCLSSFYAISQNSMHYQNKNRN